LRGGAAVDGRAVRHYDVATLGQHVGGGCSSDDCGRSARRLVPISEQKQQRRTHFIDGLIHTE